MIDIVALLAFGIGGYMVFGMFVSQTEKKPVKAETSKEEEEPLEPLEVTEEVQMALDDDRWFYDLNCRLSDGTETRQDYSVELSDNKISKDLLKYVATEIACGSYSSLGAFSGGYEDYGIWSCRWAYNGCDRSRV